MFLILLLNAFGIHGHTEKNHGIDRMQYKGHRVT